MRPFNQLMSFAATACLALMFIAPARGATADPRAYGGLKIVLQIDQETRPVVSIEGGTVRAPVVVEKTGKKHIAGPVVDPIRAKCNVKDFSTLITNALADPTQIQRVNGTIYTLDYAGKVVTSRNFLNAILTEVDFPALDPASKEPATMTIVLEPEQVRDVGGDAKAVPLSGGPGSSKAAAAIVNRFTLDIPGVDAKRASKVEAITVSRKVSENPVGEMRDYQKTPANWEVSNIVLSVPQVDAAPFVKWHEDFVIKGICDDGHEKSVTLTAMDAMANPQYTLNFGNVGIIAVAPQPMQSNVDQIAQMRVELYAERMTLTGGATAPAGGPPAAGAPAPSPAPAPANDTGTAAGPAGAAGAPAAAAATDAGAATATPAPTATGTPTRKKHPPAPLATAPTLTPAPEPSPTLTPAPPTGEPLAKPTRKTPRG